jgi:2-methylcitrate dehydratase PrpD
MSSTYISDSQPTHALAEFAAALTYYDLPSEIVATTKQMILDCLGTALAATTLGDGCRESMAVMQDLGGKPESTILGLGAKVAAPNAAFANGALVHALNYDPIGRGVGHLGVVCLAAPLAMAEAVGGISGRQFIAASVAACEVTARVTASIARTGRELSEKHLPGQLLSYFGAAVGAGHVLGLSADKMRSALGISLMQAAGSRQVVITGDPPAKAIYGAFPNQAGVLAALLSEKGLGADCEVLGEPAGLLSMVYDGACDLDALIGGLGTEFLMSKVQFKPWPTSGNLHPFIEAAAEIKRIGLDPADIAEVGIVARDRLRDWCEPLDKRRRPENAAAAANSIPFCVAKTLVHGDISLADFAPEGLNDAAAIAVAERTTYRLEKNLEGGIVTVKTPDGQCLEARGAAPGGRPVSQGQITKKFRDCCRHSVAPLPPDRIESLIAMIGELDALDDVRNLATLASGGN